jgi:hypothetical protein
MFSLSLRRCPAEYCRPTPAGSELPSRRSPRASRQPAEGRRRGLREAMLRQGAATSWTSQSTSTPPSSLDVATMVCWGRRWTERQRLCVWTLGFWHTAKSPPAMDGSIRGGVACFHRKVSRRLSTESVGLHESTSGRSPIPIRRPRGSFTSSQTTALTRRNGRSLLAFTPSRQS